MPVSAIDTIESHAQKIKAGQHDRIGPGVPARMSNALLPGEAVAQGDLNLVMLSAAVLASLHQVREAVHAVMENLGIPNPRTVAEAYCLVENTAADALRLVPGTTAGSRHMLDSMAGVTKYCPNDWSDTSKFGPVLVLTEERVVTHPTHGHVTLPTGCTVMCVYSREYDAEQAEERRSAD